MEDHGEWLNFRIKVGSQTVPVRMTREAIEDHFGGPNAGESLEQAYIRNSEEINAKAQAKIVEGTPYSREQPLVLRSADL